MRRCRCGEQNREAAGVEQLFQTRADSSVMVLGILLGEVRWYLPEQVVGPGVGTL